MTKGVSRQRLWQIKKIAAGLCMICGKPRYGATYCKFHHVKYRMDRRNRIGNKPWAPGMPGSPPLEERRKK